MAITADLASKDFDPIAHLLDFDKLNQNTMTSLQSLLEKWKAAVLINLQGLLTPDALLAHLEEDGAFTLSLLSGLSSARKRMKELGNASTLQQELNGYLPQGKKPLLTAQTDYNLQALYQVTEGYKRLWEERMSYLFLSALQDSLETIRAQLRQMITLRQKALRTYWQPEEKIRVLTSEGMCGRAAEEIQRHYANLAGYGSQEPLEQFSTFVLHQDKLYTQPKYWHDLFREFLSKAPKTGNFSAAFLQGKDYDGLRTGITKLAANISPMLQDYPDSRGPVPLPISAFLLNESVASQL